MITTNNVQEEKNDDEKNNIKCSRGPYATEERKKKTKEIRRKSLWCKIVRTAEAEEIETGKVEKKLLKESM